MSKFRVAFTKQAQASYISHLDLMRTFHRAFLRTGLSIRHSAGFHPHPIMSIVLPLPVGQSSLCELLDVELNEDISGEEVTRRLNQCLPAGLHILECYTPEAPVRELALLKAALFLDYDQPIPEDTVSQLRSLLKQEHLMAEKKSKHKGLTQIDIRPMLHRFSIEQAELHVIEVEVLVSAQDPGLNPALLGQVICRELPACAPDFLRVQRLMFYKKDETIFR